MDIIENYQKVRATIPAGVTLVAVSKFKPADYIQKLFEETGHKEFGENRAQEMHQKASLLSPGINWHFIGHLQTNKVKLVIPGAVLIQGVDSMRLLEAINREALRNNVVAKVLLQFHIATEETKFGFSLDECRQMMESSVFGELKNIAVTGVMGMASFTDDQALVRKEFRTLRNIFELLQKDYFTASGEFNVVSMGMSGDYQIAIGEGSTLVRIGSLIFGSR